MTTASSRTRPVRELADPDSRFLEVDGVAIHHKVATPPGGAHPTPVVLHHHFFGHTEVWRHVAPRLAEAGYVAISVDRVGFGLTERPSQRRGPEPYTRAFNRRATLALLDALGYERAAIVGSSAGGTIAVETADAQPDRVAALALLSPAITGDIGAPAPLRPILRSQPATTAARPFVRRLAGDVTPHRISRSWHTPSRATHEDAHGYERVFSARRWDLGFWRVMTSEQPPRLGAALRRITAPTLGVTGDADPVIRPGATRRTAQAIPGARFEVIQSCGHTPHEERPDALSHVLIDFLDAALARDRTRATG